MKLFAHALTLAALAVPASAQVLRYAELNTTQVARLDRAHTVLIITNGILEEHGPWLPSFTDGYYNEAIAKSLAQAIVARPGWTVVMLPTIPLGTSAANQIGNKYSFPASFAVRNDTMRDLFMDLADSAGELGFRYVFVVESHAGPLNNLALDAASDYFRDTYHGQMVSLLGLAPVADCCEPLKESLTPEQRKQNGMPIHAEALEHSTTLAVRPDLVAPGYKTAPPLPGANVAELVTIASKPDWPGYFGAPALATAAIGRKAFDEQAAALNTLALAILDGAVDPAKLPRFGNILYGATVDVQKAALQHDAAMAERHRAWLAAHPQETPKQ